MMKNNFIFTPDNNYNYPIYTSACVGNNGNPIILYYAEGFASAANHLIDISISNFGREFAPDIAVYPICFNMRHAVELYLKGYINFVDKLAKIKEIKIDSAINIMTVHDINKIWNYLTTNYTTLDKRLIDIANQISPYIKCFGEIDATGQTFRYPYDTENNKHLTQQSIINIKHLGNNFKELEKKLENFYYYQNDIIEEYQKKSFTKNLSRYDLSIIAQRLPNINEWKNDSFKEIKDNIKKEYDISSNELSKAINIIKNHYEFGYFIGTVPPLIDFNEDEFYLFIDKWCQLNDLSYIYDKSKSPIIESLWIGPNMDEDDKKNLSMSFKKGVEKFVNRCNISKDLINRIKLETIANVHALYYFSRECRYSEEYQLTTYYNHEQDCRKNIEEAIDHMLDKTILLTEVVISLLLLNQIKIARVLIDKYHLKDYIKEQLVDKKIDVSKILN